MNRRNFLKCAGASATALSIVPSHVMGGPGKIAPSEKLTVALIGCGTQGLREMVNMLPMPDVQVVAVCDPNKDSDDYVDWSKNGLRKSIAAAIGKPEWRADTQGIPGGRDVGGEMVDLYYANKAGSDKYKGCTRYADFRELLEKEKSLDAVKIMTPDHLHATIAIAAMKAGKHVLMHKPLANRVKEARLVIETARKTRVATHFIPAASGEQVSIAAQLIREGAIGNLTEIHNWSNRPVWPQYATLPTDTPPITKGFDWDLWLGPSLDRPYHPNYTHAVFRGWYEFGGGAIADMGHYSLWRVFSEFDLDAPVLVESTPSHVCTLKDKVSTKIKNDYSFPMACTIRLKFAAKGNRPAINLFWYDGGIRPPTPEELEKENAELPIEGMMFVGDKGKILAGFLCQNPRVLSSQKKDVLPEAKQKNVDWVKAFKGGEPTSGNFLLAGPISEAFNLGAVSLRMGGKRLLWDSSNMKITNNSDAEKYLTREYRKGWELTSV
ncbi:MAG: Gfo/Idh/MocA family oxidoreductase [Kiritimatiellae bacterium]|nr:Gfo/Idh/MocA family oxidoreductase [Kiritimatiellia bacterium]MDD5522457.1 Gfo/Idh/MocA family oxidoreductase [Kiritimatiellia bacterium]